MLSFDGRFGEGGGQVLRSSLSLSAALGVPFRMENIRGGRKKPGLLRQHLTAVRAAAEISGGAARGAELGSTELEFTPGEVRGGEYHFAIGSAGSAMLVLQTVLPPLMLAKKKSRVVVEGGTHNPWAPPFEALERSVVPLLAKMGAGVELVLERPGFFPAGGGRVVADIRPATEPSPFELMERGPEVSHGAEVIVAHLPDFIAERELRALGKRLPWVRTHGEILRFDESAGPGNAMHVTLAFRDVTEVFTGFGKKGIRAELIAKELAAESARYLTHDAPVGDHLADQLMLPLALLAGGRYRVTGVTPHTRTNAEIVSRFLPGAVRIDEGEASGATIVVSGAV